MPSIATCPFCQGAVLLPSVDDPMASWQCPLCFNSFAVCQLPIPHTPLPPAALPIEPGSLGSEPESIAVDSEPLASAEMPAHSEEAFAPAAHETAMATEAASGLEPGSFDFLMSQPTGLEAPAADVATGNVAHEDEGFFEPAFEPHEPALEPREPDFEPRFSVAGESAGEFAGVEQGMFGETAPSADAETFAFATPALAALADIYAHRARANGKSPEPEKPLETIEEEHDFNVSTTGPKEGELAGWVESDDAGGIYQIASEPNFEGQSDTGGESYSAPYVSYKARPKQREAGILGQLVGVVGGGVLGLALGYWILLWLGYFLGRNTDIFEIKAKLPGWAVPADQYSE
jgi:hypothetical protein